MRINESVIHLDGMKGANSYLFISHTGEIFLIDSGLPGNLKIFLRELSRYDIPPEKISLIILTHSDIDHAGSAAEISRATGARIAVHSIEHAYFSGERRKIHHGMFPVLLAYMSGLIPGERAIPAVMLEDGDSVGGLTVLHCPGHTAGSISLYLPGSFMFSGDTVCTDRSGRLKGFSPRFTEDSKLAYSSMVRLSTFEYDTLLPGHGAYITGSASSRVREFIDVERMSIKRELSV